MGELRCSVCNQTSSALMKAFKISKPGVRVIDESWVGYCPECRIAYCIYHATKIPDPIYGDPVPACPRHKRLLQYGLLREGTIFSPDYRRKAYIVQRQDKWSVVIDDVEGKAYDGILKDSITFSPDSQRLAFGIKAGDKWKIVTDGVEGISCDAILSFTPILTFSPDSRRIAYGARVGAKPSVVVDGVEGKAYDVILKDSMTFSPNSQRIAFGIKDGDKWKVVTDGVEGIPCDAILAFSPIINFSQDSSRIVYGARIGAKSSMVIDGVEGKSYDGFRSPLTFSPDCQRYAYYAKTGDKWTVVVDGVEGNAYDGILQFTPIFKFSSDSRRIGYGARLGGKSLTVVDGVEGKSYDAVMNPLTFSPDYQRVAYGAKIGDKWTVVVDGVEGPFFDGIIKESLAFSPDNKQVSYKAISEGKVHECIIALDRLDGGVAPAEIAKTTSNSDVRKTTDKELSDQADITKPESPLPAGFQLGKTEKRANGICVTENCDGPVTFPNDHVIIESGITVRGEVRALIVEVLGGAAVFGNVRGEAEVHVKKDARLVGDITTARILLEDGAYFKGGLKIIRRDQAAPADIARTHSQPEVRKAALADQGLRVAAKQKLLGLPTELLIGEYLRHLAADWWARQPSSRSVATCDACSAGPVRRGEGYLIGSSLWCDECYRDKDVEGQLRRNPDYAGHGILQRARRWAES